MKKLVGIILALCSVITGHASHIVGGEIFYDYVGPNQYTVTVKLYRDCLSDGAAYDTNLPVTVFNGSGVELTTFTIPFPGSTILPVQFSNPCVTIPNDICVEEAIYQKTVTLPASNNGWTLSYQRCCRGPNVVNLLDPQDQGLTLTVDIPPVSSTPINSSPRFNNFPPLLLCANDPLTFDHSATDPDGDVLEYELCTPFQGGTSLAPAPNPASAPPYQQVNWQSGITAINPFGNGSISIDPQTGLMVAAPLQAGLYAVGVCVNEYRNGALIGTSRRDFLFRVMNCEIQMDAIITQQPDLSTFVSYCQGLTINFENETYGGTNYLWDFGVLGTNDDQSTSFEPSYTYPGPGTYEVMLIVNPGWPCTDTAYGTFIVNNEISAFFEPPEPQCVIGNSFDFVGDGVYPAGSTFLWSFGSNATPSTSVDENPTGIVYSTHGTQTVTYAVTYQQCHTSYTDEVIVAAPPTINFAIPDELKCVPYTAQFTNLSTASTPIYSLWDFGDGTTSTDTHPMHVYDQVGVYDVNLTIWTTTGCIDTLDMFRPHLIEVFPRPTSSFTVSPYEMNEYDNNFLFIDQSTDAVSSWFHFADGTAAQQSDSIWHHYIEPGVYLPWQVVFNEFGCSDITYGQLKVIPVMPIMVPNAFTPNGDSYNQAFQPVLYEDQEYELFIYNRWGELIHYEKAVNANWDGRYNGVECEDGVYIWKIIYRTFTDDETPQVITGHVAVIR
ncbi:MAG: PKD domain-containing protein [Crocinitomicaceae bacterium]